jgi:hypothetical protein
MRWDTRTRNKEQIGKVRDKKEKDEKGEEDG